ncbi:MAG: Fe-S cluster assembly protein IscX [Planctomycetota bacterium]
MTFSWTDIDEIAYQLTEQRPDDDPLTVKFTDLRSYIEVLEGFEPEPGQSVNEQLLEAIQQAWIEEKEDLADGADSEEDDPSGYSPNQPFR